MVNVHLLARDQARHKLKIGVKNMKIVLAISLFCCVTFRKYNGITGVIGPAIFGGFDSRNVTNFKKFML